MSEKWRISNEENADSDPDQANRIDEEEEGEEEEGDDPTMMIPKEFIENLIGIHIEQKK